MAGGSGTRFWPASRRLSPKQLLKIAPGSTESLIAGTVRRLTAVCPAERVLIATGEHLLEATRGELPQLPAACFLGEPQARNTAPCIGWAAAIVARTDPDAVVVVVPSDQHVADEPAYVAALKRAIASAEDGVITTIGVQPSRPETGYGYIELGELCADIASQAQGAAGSTPSAPLHRVRRFVEKPDRVTAEGYLASGRYVWNAGMFIFRARDMLSAIEQHLPELHAGLLRIDAAAQVSAEEELAVTRDVFLSTPSISIDYGVMERAERLHVVPASFGWSDLGSWESSWELGARDADENVAPEHSVLIDAKRNLVCDVRTNAATKRVIALVGVEDLCVIETDDALLVIPRERAQDVREVVEQLKRSERGDLT